MKPWRLWVATGVLVAGAGALGWLIVDDQGYFRGQRSHERRALIFPGPSQPDTVGPVRIRVLGTLASGRVRVVARSDYLGIAAEEGRAYGDETALVDLGSTSASGKLGEVIEIPRLKFDRRARTVLRDGKAQAYLAVSGLDQPICLAVVEEDKMTDVVVMDCR